MYDIHKKQRQTGAPATASGLSGNGEDYLTRFASQTAGVALCYHDVYATGTGIHVVGVDERHYAVSAESLRSHVDGARDCATRERETGSGGAPRAVLFTFDDGWESAVTVVAPLLEELDCRGVFFVTTGMVGCQGFLRRDQIRELHRRGHIIGSHTHTHPDFINRYSQSKIRREWGTSIAILADLLGAPVTSASVPSGAFSARVADVAAECGVRHLFTSRPAIVPNRHSEITIYGRFSVTSQTTIEDIRSFLRASSHDLRMMQMRWDARRAASRLGGSLWLALRRALLRARQ